jgi:hypothetical protein
MATMMWVNHFDLLPEDSSVTTTCSNNDIGADFPDLVIQSSTTGAKAKNGAWKCVHMGLQIPPGYKPTAVRLCYQLSNTRSFISGIHLSQVLAPYTGALIKLNDNTAQNKLGPVFADSQSVPPIDPSLGVIILELLVNFGNTSDKIMIHALGLNLYP